MWENLGRQSAAQEVEEQILRELDSGSLSVGERLPPERELAAKLGVSRPTVREAIGSLKARGRVEVVHGRGVFVTEPSSVRDLRSALYSQQHTLGELFAMREVLEVPAAGWAAQRQDTAALDRVGQALERLNTTAARAHPRFDELREMDSAFHLAIVEAAGNRFLRGTLGVLQDILAKGMETTLRIPGRLEKSRHDHEQILEALVSGDPTAARRATRQHVRAAHRAALRRIRTEAAAQGGGEDGTREGGEV